MTARTQLLAGALIAVAWIGVEAAVNQVASNPTGGVLLLATGALLWVARIIFVTGRPR